MDRFSLDDILNSDPLELLSDLKVKNPVITADDRLIATFEEINDFYEKHNCEPQKTTDMNERRLYSRLKGLREHPQKREALKKYDRFDLLLSDKIISLDDIFENDPLGLLSQNEEDIFTLIHIPKITTMPDYVSSRKACKEFEKYEYLFVACQNDLKNRKRELIKFQNEQQIKKGYYFVLNGILLYVLDVGVPFKKQGKTNARLKLIFENATESDMLLRSLSAELYKNGQRVSEYDESKIEGLYEVDDDDTQNGYIYILKSLSNEDVIRTKKNLFKIGFSTTGVETRIKNAVNDPTYLMAEVQTVSAYEVYNVNPHKLEQLIHKFFSSSCLNIDIFDGKGNVHKPREWFIAPLSVIEEAVELIISARIIDYRYDEINDVIIEKKG
ncbi:MAG: GIY-YIG nuclease family protein [Sulfurovum sp.]|nr:GIY-YIG nuclease family protein [Sulfurovum sp.]